MDKEVIGDKESFGIQLALVEDSFFHEGYVTFWLNGLPIGKPNGKSFLFTIKKELVRVLNQVHFFNELSGLSSHEIFEMITESYSESNYDVTIINFGSSFDEYIMRVIKTSDSKFYFLWKFSSEKDILRTAFVEEAHYRIVVSEFLKRIDNV